MRYTRRSEALASTIYNWHSWFAWRPVTVRYGIDLDQRVWLERIERRALAATIMGYIFEYRDATR